ncbi:MAG: tetratricopeptide repeat protein, partial [Armatimonadota bacterium]
ARWLTLVWLPLSAELAPKLLLAPFALAWLGMRWWAEIAERTADRGAAIAVGGPEPVAHWLAAALGHDRAALRRHFTHASHGEDWEIAEVELHAIVPRLAHRIVRLTQFTASAKFTNCLGIVGDLNLPTIAPRHDPASAGVMPQVLIGLLAGLWLTPVAVWLTVAISTPPTVRTVEAPEQDVEMFSPETAPGQTDGVDAERSPAPAQPPAGSLSGAEAVEGMLDLARAHKDREEYDKALRVLQDLIEIDPTIPEAHYLLAWTWIGLGDPEEAKKEFTAAANLTEPGDEMHDEAVAALERME